MSSDLELRPILQLEVVLRSIIRAIVVAFPGESGHLNRMSRLFERLLRS